MFGGKKWREIIELDIFNIETTYINTVMKLHWKENGGPMVNWADSIRTWPICSNEKSLIGEG